MKFIHVERRPHPQGPAARVLGTGGAPPDLSRSGEKPGQHVLGAAHVLDHLGGRGRAVAPADRGEDAAVLQIR
jgi:hypothetical protein